MWYKKYEKNINIIRLFLKLKILRWCCVHLICIFTDILHVRCLAMISLSILIIFYIKGHAALWWQVPTLHASYHFDNVNTSGFLYGCCVYSYFEADNVVSLREPSISILSRPHTRPCLARWRLICIKVHVYLRCSWRTCWAYKLPGNVYIYHWKAHIKRTHGSLKGCI